MNVLVRTIGLLAVCGSVAVSPSRSFAFFEPDVTLSDAERRQLDRGEAVAHTLPTQGREVGVFAAVPVSVTADRFVSWIEHIDRLKKSEYVPSIHRFSTPPSDEDVADLTLDADDLDTIAECDPDNCDLKLSPDEIRALLRQPAAEREGEFRRILLARVMRYLAGQEPADGSSHVIAHSRFLTSGDPELARRLSHPLDPRRDEGFLYWSKEHLASRSIVIVTDVRIARSDEPGRPVVLVVGKEIFWTRYLSASLGVTALVRGRTPEANYLAYVNRSEVDAVHGLFGGILRWVIQRRLASEATDVLRGLRTRLESGEP